MEWGYTGTSQYRDVLYNGDRGMDTLKFESCLDLKLTTGYLKTTTTLFKLSSFIWLDVNIEYKTAGYWTVINILALTSNPSMLWNSLAYKSSFAV